MKKIFSILLIATFASYAFYTYQSNQSQSIQPLVLATQPAATTTVRSPAPQTSAPTLAPAPNPSAENTSLQAQGTIQITNKSNSPIFLVKTTRLLTPDGKLFHLAQGVLVPVNNPVTATIYADQNGSAYAVDPTHFTFPGLSSDLQNSIYATSSVTLALAQPYAGSIAQAPSTPVPQPTPQQPTPTPTPTPQPVAIPTPVVPKKPTGVYKDGTYTGDSVDAYYGNIQVAAVIQNGKLSDVQILDYPRDRRTSQSINGQALPMLISEAIQAQSANINAISGASETSPAFKQSLASALAQAKN